MKSNEKYEPQTPEGKSFIEKLRLYMLDYPEINVLLKKQEALTQTLMLATEMMLSDVIAQPPLINSICTLKSILSAGMISPALKLAAANVLDSKLQWQERNQLQYSDGTKNEVINDKAESYRRTSSILRSEAMKAFAEWKLCYNVRRGFGIAGIGSVYSGSGFII